MYVRCTGQKTTGSSLSRLFATPHALPTSLHTPGKPPRLACLLGGCEGSRRCKWVIPHPSLFECQMPCLRWPVFRDLEGAPVTPHVSNTNLLPEVLAHLDPRLPESSHPHTTLWRQRLNFLKWRPRGRVVSSGLYLCGTSRSSLFQY